MADKIHQRDETQGLTFVEDTPLSNALADVQARDLWVQADAFYFRDDSNTSWVKVNDYTFLDNVPLEFIPIVHELDGTYHTGTLDIKQHIRGHNLLNLQHQQIMGIAFAIGV